MYNVGVGGVMCTFVSLDKPQMNVITRTKNEREDANTKTETG